MSVRNNYIHCIMDEEDIDEYLYGKEAASAVKAASFVKPDIDTNSKSQPHDKVTQKGALSSLYTDLNEESLRDDVEQTEEYMIDDNQQDDDIEIVLDETSEPQEKQLTSISTSKSNTIPGQGINSPGSRPSIQQKNLVIYGVPEYEGQSIFNVDLDTIEDKPWRKPGADITDYFNFGFDEYTWRQYCYKQKLLKDETTKTGKRLDKSKISISTSSQHQSTPVSSTLPPPPPPPHHIIMASNAKSEVPPPPPTLSTSRKQASTSRSYDQQYKPHQNRHNSRRESSSRSRSPSRER